ncbi:hypothetical protein AZE42_07187 [Rhizopogon vesiculosus]|uniref:F-box domain-containing protein n=1 Tax=Rhizopogon vesiculosus TaxID=180088 RepID=A0A1J8PRA9_9AGAM|nr:hypothetical protein AZE42_07187 [Rhizopogon vesiculosus]
MVLPQDSRHLHLFLSSTLRRCELRTIDPNLEYIATRCAVLERLSFESSYSLATASDISLLSDTIRSCNRLVELCCPLLDSEGFRCLANLPTLVRLNINGPGADDLLDRDVLTLAPFLNLTALSIVLGKPFSVEVENIIMVMQHSKFPSLKKFKLFTDDILWEEAEQFFISLSQCGASQTLEHVNIYLRDSEARRNPFLVITHFLRFTQLRYLRLDIGIPIYLDNNLLLEAVSSWPRIESLELLDQEEISSVTFHGLFAALLLCPRLHTLQVSMDAANIDIDPKAESFQHPSLQKLHLCSSPVTDAETVAFIIFSRLPRVSEVEYDEYFDASLPVWRQVSRHHRSLKQNAIQGLTA